MTQKKVWNQTYPFKNQSGATLVEMIVSIAILALVVTSFLAFFINSAKATRSSEQVTDATYVAQQEMEYLTHLSNDGSLEQMIKEISLNYTPISKNGLNRSYSFQRDNIFFTLQMKEKKNVKLSNPLDDQILMNLILIGTRESKVEVQLETTLSFENGDKNDQ